MWKVSNLLRKTEQKAKDAPPVFPDAHGPTGWTWSSFPGLRSCGAAAAPRPLCTAFPPTTSLLHLCFKTRLLTTISPPFPFPRSHRRKQNTNLFLKPCFSTINCSGADRCLARFLSSIHERRRGRNAHVNTGNDTNDQKKKGDRE